MPNGIFPVPEFRSPPVRTSPSLAVRIRARWGRNRLDKALADGVDPAASAELMLRAAQLRSPAVRAQLADALTETLGDAHRGEPVTIKARPQRAVVRAAGDDLLALVARLRDERPIDLRGAALTALLVNDRSGPLHAAAADHLAEALRSARAALDGDPGASEELATAA